MIESPNATTVMAFPLLSLANNELNWSEFRIDAPACRSTLSQILPRPSAACALHRLMSLGSFETPHETERSRNRSRCMVVA